MSIPTIFSLFINTTRNIPTHKSLSLKFSLDFPLSYNFLISFISSKLHIKSISRPWPDVATIDCQLPSLHVHYQFILCSELFPYPLETGGVIARSIDKNLIFKALLCWKTLEFGVLGAHDSHVFPFFGVNLIRY